MKTNIKYYKQWLIVFLFVGFTGVLIWQISSLSKPENQSLAGQTEKQVDANLQDIQPNKLQQKLALMTQTINRLESRLDRQENNLAENRNVQIVEDDEANVLYPDTEDPDLVQGIQQEKAAVIHQNKMAALNTLLKEEEADQDWAKSVSDNVYQAFENKSDQYELEDLVCGNSVCKLEASIKLADDEDMLIAPNLEHLLHGEIDWPGGTIYELDTETGKFTVFMKREGEALYSEDEEG